MDHPFQKSKQSYMASRWHLDPWLMLALLALFVYGSIVLFAAADQSWDKMQAHFLRGVLAFGIMLAVAQVPPHVFSIMAPWAYLLGLILLLMVLFMGEIGKGAQRWLDLGVVRFQPSEIMKLALPLMVAWILAEGFLPPNPKSLFAALVAIVIPTALIVKQPDLGTAILVAASGLFIVFFAGIAWRWILAAFALVAAAGPIIWANMYDYQKQRVLTFISPESDPLGKGYHIIQSKIAIGSGGVFGQGWLEGSQSQLSFLPEQTTDFIFSVLAEGFGLVGVGILLLLFLAILLRGYFLAYYAQGNFNRLLSASLMTVFFVYIFVNIGMVSGILPVVGVPLPFVSYGGTSMISLAIGFGIIMSINTHRRLLSND